MVPQAESFKLAESADNDLRQLAWEINYCKDMDFKVSFGTTRKTRSLAAGSSYCSADLA